MLNLTDACWRWREIFLVLVACLLEASVHQIFSKAHFCSINDFSPRGLEKMCDSFRVFRITRWGCFSGQTSESAVSIIPHSFSLLFKKYLFLFVCVYEREGGKHKCVSAVMHTYARRRQKGALTLLRYQTPSIPLRWDLSLNSELRSQPGWKPTSRSDPPATCCLELGTWELVGRPVCSVCAGIWTLGLMILYS